MTAQRGMTSATAGAAVRARLDRETWTARAAAHAERADALTAEHRARQARREKHPVHDFLFTYYGYKPGQLRRWHPGAGVVLEDAPERAGWRWYSPDPDSGTAPTASCRTRRPSPPRSRNWLLSSGPCSRAPRHDPASSAASGCTSGRWSTARPSIVTRCRCGSDRPAPTSWSSRASCAARTSTRSASSPRTPCRATGSPRPARPSRCSSSPAACTPGWTCTSGR